MALRDVAMCPRCLHHLAEADRLRKKLARAEADNRRLRERLGKQNRTIHELPFGSSTPPSKLPYKPGADAAAKLRQGGAKAGHPGHGRRPHAHLPRLPDLTVSAGCSCPDCHGALEKPSQRVRTVVRWQPTPPAVQKVTQEERWCSHCRKMVRPSVPGVLPQMLLDNGALAQVALLHYLEGLTIGHLARLTGLNKSTLIESQHRLAELLEPVLPRLLAEVRGAGVIFGDETTWRNNGDNGYAWMLKSVDTVVYAFRGTRAGAVARELVGDQPLPGVLSTDRYAGYNGLPIARQFCYAHLLRDLEDLEKEFPGQPEVAAFIKALKPKLQAAMRLRRHYTSLASFHRRARRLKATIQEIVNRPARHAGVQSYQTIFRENPDKLYHWADDPLIPAENNTAERHLRRTVIARKLSFGSQSARGAKTREILMSVLGTLALRTPDPWLVLRNALNQIAEQPQRRPDIDAILFDEPALAACA